MSMTGLWVPALWVGYAALLLFISRWAKGKDALAPGRVGTTVQAFAYIATYISAVALVGFGGLCHKFGLQMLLVAAGNVWLGTWFVYRFLAWPTRLWQHRLNAKTPAEMLSKAYSAPKLQAFLGLLSALLLIIYGSVVFRGAALMISEILAVSLNSALIFLILIVGISVSVGGLRGVLYTEALQGLIMLLGVTMLLVAVFKLVGGPIAGLEALAALPATPEANRGFVSFSSGAPGLNIITLTLVTSVGVWAQPQLIQRHFALKNRRESAKVAPLAMLALVFVVGGAYVAGGFSRLIVGPEVTNPDTVIPVLVHKLLPAAGQQLFALAVVSASLSTASALMHIASGSLWRDVMHLEDSHGFAWKGSVLFCVALCGVFALNSSTIIAIVCTTSWSLLACAVLIPYLSLLAFGTRFGATAAWCGSLGGIVSCCLWYAFGYAPTSAQISGIVLPGIVGAINPILVGIPASLLLFVIGGALESRSNGIALEQVD